MEEEELRRILREELEEISGNMSIKKSWSLLITKVDNGFILQNPSNDSVDTFDELVIQEKNECDEKLSEAKLIRELFWNIREYFGIFYSKHNKYNLELKIVDEKDKEVRE